MPNTDAIKSNYSVSPSLYYYPLIREKNIVHTLFLKEINGRFNKSNISSWQFLPKEELLNNLLTSDPKDAISVIHTPAIFKKLTFTERLKVFSRYTPFALAIYNNPNICNQLKESMLAIVGQNSLKISQSIINNLQQLNKLQGDDIIELGSKEVEIAKFIISKLLEPEEELSEDAKLIKFNLTKKIGRYNLITLGKIFPEIADMILSSDVLLKKMEEEGVSIIQSLSELCSNSFENAEKILSKPLFSENVSSDQLKQLGMNNVKTSFSIIKDPKFLSKLNVSDLVALAKNSPELASEILLDSSLWSKFDSNDLVLLCQNNLEISKIIFNNDNLCTKLDGFSLAKIGKNNVFIAQLILNTPALCEKLQPIDLATLGENNVEIANKIVNTAKFIDKFNGYELAILGKNHREIAHLILNNNKWRAKMDSIDLYEISQKNSDIAKILFTYDDVSTILEGQDLFDIASQSYEVFNVIFNTPSLWEKVSDVEGIVSYFCQNIPENIQLIVSKCEDLTYADGDDELSIFHRIKSDQRLYQELKEKIKLWEMLYNTCIGVLEHNEVANNKMKLG